jgi:hypothetical protein
MERQRSADHSLLITDLSELRLAHSCSVMLKLSNFTLMAACSVYGPLKTATCSSALANGFYFIIMITLWQSVRARAPNFCDGLLPITVPTLCTFGSESYKQKRAQNLFSLCTQMLLLMDGG